MDYLSLLANVYTYDALERIQNLRLAAHVGWNYADVQGKSKDELITEMKKLLTGPDLHDMLSSKASSFEIPSNLLTVCTTGANAFCGERGPYGTSPRGIYQTPASNVLPIAIIPTIMQTLQDVCAIYEKDPLTGGPARKYLFSITSTFAHDLDISGDVIPDAQKLPSDISLCATSDTKWFVSKTEES